MYLYIASNIRSFPFSANRGSPKSKDLICIEEIQIGWGYVLNDSLDCQERMFRCFMDTQARGYIHKVFLKQVVSKGTAL